jgi:hypothetical protein
MMKKTVTYPLDVALDLSPQWGATLETQSAWVRVVPVMDWQVSVYRGGNLVQTICRTHQACLEFLMLNAYPIDGGWLPALPACTEPDSNGA